MNKDIRIVYMGTPDFAVPAFIALCDAGFDMRYAVTQPDRPKGRSGKPVFPPVKEEAVKRGIEVLQPEKASDPAFMELLRQAEPDIIVVAAYGKILKKELLDIPRYGCINIHASLLPKYRGAAPIQWSIINGEKETGVTTMMMDEGLDTGDMLLKYKVEIGPEETADELSDKLASAGGGLILETIDRLLKGDLKREKQDNEKTGMYARMLKKTDGELDFSLTAEELDRRIRGLYSWPCAYTHINGKILKILKAHAVEGGDGPEPYGTVTGVTKKTITVRCGSGELTIDRVQPEGKKPMDTAAYLAGSRIAAGTVMGQEEK